MNHHDSRYEELLAPYALDALEGEERDELERHLASGCERCQAELAEWRRDLEQLAGSVPPVEPSEITRARLLAAVRERAAVAPVPTPAPRSRPRLWDVVAVAASLAAVALAAGALSRQGDLQRELAVVAAERERLSRELSQLRGELEGTRGELARLGSAVAILAAPEAQSIVLAGLGGAPEAGGTTVLHPQRQRAVFYAHDLPALPADKTYQLWLIAGGRPISAGVFAVDARGEATVEVAGVPPPEGIDAWAVTVEPAGGVPQPTGEMVLKS